MAGAAIAITLDGGEPWGDTRRYDPGSEVSGTVQVTPPGELHLQHLWVRARWHTMGRGSPDSGTGAEADLFQGDLPAGVPRSFGFRVSLPREPWSYSGTYIGIVWELEVTLALPLARDEHARQTFVLRPA